MRTPRPQRSRSARQGFTLIELLVVVAIIALLVAILLPSLSAARRNSQKAACGANLHAIGRAAHSYHGEFSSVPRSIRALFNTTKDPQAMVQWFRSEGTWKLLGAPGPSLDMAPYLGGAASKTQVCPGTGVVSAYTLSNGGGISWFDALSGTLWPQNTSLDKSNNYVYSHYYYFGGDPGNRFRNNYYRDQSLSTKYDGIEYPPSGKITTLGPRSILAQDLLRIDSGPLGTGLPQGNHTLGRGEQKPTFPTTSALYSGGKIWVQGYYIGNAINDFSGGNVLYLDGSVSFLSPGDMTVVYSMDNNNGGALGYTNYWGAPQ